MVDEALRRQVRHYVNERLANEAGTYLGRDARLVDVQLDEGGALRVRFTSASRPDSVASWRWFFPGPPPEGHPVDETDLVSYAGWALVMLQEAVVTGRGIETLPG